MKRLRRGTRTHWGNGIGGIGLVQHKGAKENCPAPECGPVYRETRWLLRAMNVAIGVSVTATLVLIAFVAWELAR